MKLFVFSSRKFQLVIKYKTTVSTVLLVTLSPWTLTKTCISNIAELLLFVSSPQNCPLTSFNIILWPFLSQVVSTLVLVTCVEWDDVVHRAPQHKTRFLYEKMQLSWQTSYMWKMAQLGQNQKCIPLSPLPTVQCLSGMRSTGRGVTLILYTRLWMIV